jgi:hypothetical protein
VSSDVLKASEITRAGKTPAVLVLAARKCVRPVFNPADERLAAQLFQEYVDLKHIEHAILLACARR